MLIAIQVKPDSNDDNEDNGPSLVPCMGAEAPPTHYVLMVDSRLLTTTYRCKWWRLQFALVLLNEYFNIKSKRCHSGKDLVDQVHPFHQIRDPGCHL